MGFLLLGAVLLAWGWRLLSRRLASASLTKGRAVSYYALWALLPVALFVAAFFLAVGLEEWLDVSVLSEEMARATLPLAAALLAIGIVAWIAFALWNLRRVTP